MTTARTRWWLRGAWIAGIVIFCIVWPALEYPRFDIERQQHLEAMLQLVLLHGSWLLWPLLLQSAIKAWRCAGERRVLRACGASLLALVCALLCYGRFVEPNLLVVQRTVVPAPIDMNIALVSDTHIGIYTRTGKLEQMVRKLNSLNVDMVLIAGDLTYDPPHDLAAALAPLRRLNKPTYAVLGNHDVQSPGPPLARKIFRALAGSPVHFIEHRVIEFHGFRLAGLYDWWSGRTDTTFLRNLPQNKPLLVLMHQPHSLRALHGVHFSLAMAGHTHGGQVYLPWLTHQLFLWIRDERYIEGYYDTPWGELFVTRGIGVTGLPVRFNCPPTIDVLELRRHAQRRDPGPTGPSRFVHTKARAPTTPTKSSRSDDPATPLTQGG